MSPESGAPQQPARGSDPELLERALIAEEEARPDRTWLPLRILEVIGGVLVLALALGVSTAVALRGFGHGMIGVVELGSLSMLFLVLLGAPALAGRDRHVRLELLDYFTGPRVLRALSHFGSAVQLVVTGLLMAAMWQVLQTDLSRGTTTGGELRLERWWVSGFALAGLAALALGIGYRWLVTARSGSRQED